jgi:hypothetical protein
MIRDVVVDEVLTSYTRWLECVQVKEGPEPEVYVAFSPRFERIWLESKETSSGVHGAEAGQYRAPEPVLVASLQVGEKVRQGRSQNHFARGASKRVRPGVD